MTNTVYPLEKSSSGQGLIFRTTFTPVAKNSDLFRPYNASDLSLIASELDFSASILTMGFPPFAAVIVELNTERSEDMVLVSVPVTKLGDSNTSEGGVVLFASALE